MRLDKYLQENGYFQSREKAQTAIKHKTVKVNGLLCTKPSAEISENTSVEVIDVFNKFVSMGGLKLEKAIKDFALDFYDKTVLDIGSSTGGFTDCSLQYGAKFVAAVDVGTAQLDIKMLENPKVQSIENKDFRELQPDDVANIKFDFIVSDVSFISLTMIIPHIKNFLADNGKIVFLIKPQFEAGASFLNKSGIVTNEKGYKIAIQRVVEEAMINGYFLHELTVSTLFEKHKNVEFLALFSQQSSKFVPDFNNLYSEIRKIKKDL